jgi:hypothetical protein
MTDDIYLNPPEATALLYKLGVRRSVKTLAKLRCIGGGPIFQTVGRSPIYTERRLLEYARSLLSPERTSSSGRTHRGQFGHRHMANGGPEAA